jgi:hypothetical protein
MLIRWTTGLLKHRHWSDQQKWRPAYRWPALIHPEGLPYAIGNEARF